MPPPLPPRLAERLETLAWPATFEEADREIGVGRAWVMVGDRRVRVTSYRHDLHEWPLGAAIVDAILDTVGPAAAGLMRRRVVLLPPAKGNAARDDLVAVRRVAQPVADATEVDLLWAVDPVGARALVWPTAIEVTGGEGSAPATPEQVAAGRLRLVHRLDWACSIIDSSGRPRKTIRYEPAHLVARWGEALTPNAYRLVEHGRALPREQLSIDDEGGES